jgi:hypothetical protein
MATIKSYTWADVERLVTQIAYYTTREWGPLGSVCGVAPAGVIPAVMLSYKLALPYVPSSLSTDRTLSISAAALPRTGFAHMPVHSCALVRPACIKPVDGFYYAEVLPEGVIAAMPWEPPTK